MVSSLIPKNGTEQAEEKHYDCKNNIAGTYL
jgi:hypothetical protein